MPLTFAKDRAKQLIKRRLAAGTFRSEATSYAPVSSEEIPVLMCLWNRPTRMTRVLELLDQQDYAPGIRLYLWNNNKADHELYRSQIADYQAAGGLRGVNLVKTPFNLGSIARFYWARRLAEAGKPIIVLDDDEEFDSSFVSTAMTSFAPRTVSAWWAYQVRESYWDRVKAEPGERVDHVGPGGSIIDSALFVNDDFFREMPAKFWMLDDIWLSYFAKSRGYTLKKLPVQMEFVMEETNQYFSQVDLKSEFYDYLYGQPPAP